MGKLILVTENNRISLWVTIDEHCYSF